ncbi:MAG: D-alanyl-D-alanine carboxypeptidase/D-alanyl-D-alanine-endopeptidase [Candidatus Brocadiia bacterium]
MKSAASTTTITPMMTIERKTTGGLKTSAFVGILTVFATLVSAGELADAIEDVLAESKLKSATVGVRVEALNSERILYSHNAMTALIPASNQKLLTAAVALTELGVEYKFLTSVWLKGDLQKDGTLNGHVILKGRGDPSLGYSKKESNARAPDSHGIFQQWAQKLVDQGIRSIAGDIIVDDTFFDRRFFHPNWPENQIWKYYCAPVAGFSFQGNCVFVTAKPAKRKGAPALISLQPDVPILEVSNYCKTSLTRNAIWFERKKNSNRIRVGGRAKAGTEGYTARVTVPNPPLFAGSAFAETLKSKGIQIKGRIRLRGAKGHKIYSGAKKVAEHSSTLKQILAPMLKESQNSYAEHVLKTVGAVAGNSGSWEEGLRQAAKFLKKLHFRPGQVVLADGSGMSRHNKLCPAALCAVLIKMDKSDEGKLFHNLLAAGGREGTLSDRFKDATCRGRVRAKTGYLRGVGCLSGYARTQSDLRVAFSIMINGFTRGGNWHMKKFEDRIVRSIIEEAR